MDQLVNALPIRSVLDHLSTLEKLVDEHGVGALPGIDDLVTTGGIEHFERYLRTCKISGASFGVDDMAAYRRFTKDGKDPCRFVGQLPHFRNYHRMSAPALTALAANWQDRSKRRPVRLLILPWGDHNGVFMRNPNIEALVLDQTHVTLALEAESSLEAISSHAGAIAEQFGPKGQIEQVIVFGHAHPTRLLGLVGSEPDPGNKAKGPKNQTDLSVYDPRERAVTEKFFRELVSHVGADQADKAQIMLWACHSDGSHPLEKEELDASTNRAARGSTSDVLAKRGNLTDSLQRSVRQSGKPVEVLGYQTFASSNDRILGANGHLSPVRLMDPAATTGHYGYIRAGRDPVDLVGALRMAWTHRAELQVAIGHRLRTPQATEMEPLVRAMLTLALAVEEPSVLLILQTIANLTLPGMTVAPHPTDFPASWTRPLYDALARTPSWKQPWTRVRALQAYASFDASHDAPLLDEIARTAPDDLRWHITPDVDSALPRLLKGSASTAAPAAVKLALAVLVHGVFDMGTRTPPAVLEFLRPSLDAQDHFTLDVKPYLPGNITPDQALAALGRGTAKVREAPPMVEAQSVSATATTRQGLSLRQGPSELYAEAEGGALPANTTVTVISQQLERGQRTGRGWYRVRTTGEGEVRMGWVPPALLVLQGSRGGRSD